MDERENTKETAVPSEKHPSIEKLLRDRQKIDEILKKKFSQNITLMFTDIKGSTTFFETYGDIEGRVMVQKHNEMLFPIIDKYQGRIIKTIGDAIMAAFNEPVSAVRSAIDMQQALLEYNRNKKEKKDKIHIRIGINTGEGLVEKHDIYGDVVNVAARIESLTQPDDIMISAQTYDDVRKTDDIICRFVNKIKIKGRAEPVEVYRVVWKDEEIEVGVTRSAAPIWKIMHKRKQPTRRLEIDISRAGETVKITAFEKTHKGQSSIRTYEERQVSMLKIDKRCQQINDLFNQANHRGKLSKDSLGQLRQIGQALFDDLLTEKAKEVLRIAPIEDVVFHIEDNLVQIPWELLYNGEQFLCQKFNMGRIVKTKQEVYNIKQRLLSYPLKMLIISDPQGDLENALSEGQAIKEQVDTHTSLISIKLISGQTPLAYLMDNIRNFDIIHYAGHADYDPVDPSGNGWLLGGGKLTAADIVKFVGDTPMPSLVFCNACYSGQTEKCKLVPNYKQEIFGMGNAFLIAGVQHYIGAFGEILDKPGARFAKGFYCAMLEGASIGEAMRQARLLLIKEFGEETIVWASYMLYGDPGSYYFNYAERDEEVLVSQPELKNDRPLQSTPSVKIGLDNMVVRCFRKKRIAFGATLLVIAFVLVFLTYHNKIDTGGGKDPYVASYSLLQKNQIEAARYGFSNLSNDDPRKYEGLAAVFYELGNYKTALVMTKKALAIAPYNLYAHVIKGHILFHQKNINEALREYETAAKLQGGIRWQKAEALNSIARIYSYRGVTEKATEFYGRAAKLNTESAEIFVNWAYTMQKNGDISNAISSFQKAVKINPYDPLASILLTQAKKKQIADADKARQQRIDKLVGELAESFRKGEVMQTQGDSRTSGPITISFLSFSSKGSPASREGEDEFFLFKLSAILQENGRVQIVERELLDKLLGELKLSSTELVDPNMALKLGRILAARIIVTGSIVRYNTNVQVNIKLTDTETTALKAALTETGESLDKLAETIAKQILTKIQTAYSM